jgi:thymidylate synthase (FAD)
MLTQVPTLNGQGFVELISHVGGDRAVIDAARVSYDGDGADRPEWADKRLIKYLLKNQHTSPFEHVHFTFHIKTPIFVARQWMRHRTWSYNEISARYTESEEGFYFPQIWRAQSTENKQASWGAIGEQGEADRAYTELMSRATWTYKKLIQLGVSREMARMALPVSTLTRFYASVDLHNLLKFFELREHPHAQREIQEYATAMRSLVQPIVPWTMEAWEEIRK